MEKLEKIFNSKLGIVLFYIVIAILALMLTKKVEVIIFDDIIYLTNGGLICFLKNCFIIF